MPENTNEIRPDQLSVKQLHQLLLSAVAPRPIALASTVSENGVVNLSPFSFFNVFSANPPVLIFSPARRVRDNTVKHTLLNAETTGEVVINCMNYAMVTQASLSSSEYPEGVNEFLKSGFTEKASSLVRPPRVAEAPVAFECIVENIIPLGKEGGAGNLILCRVVCIHVNPAYTDASGNLDVHKLDLVARMGGNWYARARGEALFEIPKPSSPLGIGVDSLPLHARESTILTGNDLGHLGNIPSAPTADALEKLQQEPAMQEILQSEDEETRVLKLHRYAKTLIKEGSFAKALACLYSL